MSTKKTNTSGEYTLKMSRVQLEDGSMRSVLNLYHYPEIPITITKEYLRSHDEKVLNTPESIKEGQHPVLLLYQQELRDYLEAQNEYSEDDLYDAFAYFWLTGDYQFMQRFCSTGINLHIEKPEIRLHYGDMFYQMHYFFAALINWHKKKNIAYKVFMGYDKNHPETKYILCRLATGGEAYRLEIKRGLVDSIFQRNNFRAEKGYYDYFTTKN